MLVFIGTQNILAQENLTQNEKLETLCKVWGFLKYYHPNVAKGTYNWDNQLIEKIKESEKTETKKQFNKMISEWIDGLGKVEICKTCNKKNDKKYFLKNFDLYWTDDENTFTKNVIEKLNFIEQNRNQEQNYYLGLEKGKIFFKNETANSSINLSREIKLYELFNYWNKIEYFFPYKYQANQNWNGVLKEMIPKFINSNTEKDYSLVFLELLSKVDDSHVVLKSNIYTKFIFGTKKVPAEYNIAENKIVVIEIPGNSMNEKSDLEIGDVILEINNQSLPNILEKYSKYVPASNEWGKLKKMKKLLLNSENPTINLKIERSGKIIEINAKTYSYKDILPAKKEAAEKWKFLDENKKIGYADIGALKVEDVKDMFENLKNTNAIIFDVRKYPNLTTREISRYLLPKKTTYYTWMRSETTYPGKFFESNADIGKANPDFYKGKVVALVNETTQSQAETLTMMLKQNPTTKVFGSQTSGANGDVIRFMVLGAETMFSGLGAFYPDGRETQRIGIVPDIEVKLTVKGLQENRDEVLERALEYIKNGK